MKRTAVLSLFIFASACTQYVLAPPKEKPPADAPPVIDPPINMPPPMQPPMDPMDMMPPPPPPPPPPPVNPAVWSRGSLTPLYQLTPRAEYGRMQHNNVTMNDGDFTTQATLTSIAQKMDEIGLLFTNRADPVTLMPEPADRQRAQLMPFRGNPSDVKVVSVNNTTKIYVPLGGDVMAPGNEVAVVTGNNTRTRVKVGLRPQRLAVHPAGLVFVCNQYSNYISVIDPATDQVLVSGGQPVEIKTEYFCADLIFVPENPRAPDADRQSLYVANRWRHSVLKYSTRVLRDPTTNRAINITQEGDPVEITGVGLNPWRLALSEQQNSIFVANNKGGELARIDLDTNAVNRISINAPTADVVNVGDLLYVPTTMPDRGLLSRDDQKPVQVLADPVYVQGLDGQRHLAHPGALFDGTRSYNFEDMRDGLMQIDFQLRNQGQTMYYTDDNSSEPNFVAQQKVLAGALPTAIVRNRAGTSIFVALAGSRLVQELAVNTNARPFTVTVRRTFSTGHRPFALAIDEDAQLLYVANWGSETLQVFDLGGGDALSTIDLGYAQPAYPATNIERGELFYYDASWSNTGRKACATCHFDELDTDGVGYSNGAEAPTAYHQVKPNHNLMTTDSYFWNGSFGNGNYTSLAFKAQTRTNCENVAFGLIEGPGSDPNRRVGDPNNAYTNGRDEECRPQSATLGVLLNQDVIDQIVADEARIAAQGIQAATGFDADTVARFMDFYSVSEMRLPPNPLRQMYQMDQLDSGVKATIAEGAQIFRAAGCAGCHDPDNARHPYADGLNHGGGADWTERFVNTYSNDPRILNSIGAFSETMLDAIATSISDHEVNIYLDPIDYFIPFCFDVTNCLVFDDPLAARGNLDEETRRLNQLIKVNLLDPDRQFIPGTVRGSPQINTPSLRGVWTQANLLHHGLGHTIRESILGPGHAALQNGETGFAVDALGNFDVHGATKNLSSGEIDSLVRYVESIQ